MRKHLSILFLFASVIGYSQSSKPHIDSAALANWTVIGDNPVISDDGKYFMYIIGNLPIGSNTLVIQQVDGEWKKEFIGAEKGIFAGGSELAVFKLEDTLYFLSLGTDVNTYVTNVKDYRQPANGEGKWIGYQKQNSMDLVIRDLFTSEEQRYTSISSYSFHDKGKILLITKKDSSNNGQSLNWINLDTQKSNIVWRANDQTDKNSAGSLTFDESGKQLAFIVQQTRAEKAFNSIWYYKEGMDKAIEKVRNESAGVDSGMVISNRGLYFSKSGKFIFFKIEPKPQPLRKIDPNAVKVDVWSYKDILLQHNQLLRSLEQKTYACVFSLYHDKIARLENVSQKVILSGDDKLVISNFKNNGDKFWIKEPATYYLFFLSDFSVRKIAESCGLFSFSPDYKHLVYYDFTINNYVSYNIPSEKKIILTDKIPVSIISDEKKERINYNRPVGIACWTAEGALLIYDNYDIWNVDVSGIKPPVNITNGYGLKNKIKFRVVVHQGLLSTGFYNSKDPFLLTAFNTESKNNGFYILNLAKRSNPDSLIMGPWNFYTISSQTNGESIGNMVPLKARNANVWIFKRQTAIDAPNYCSLVNFKTCYQLTNIQPQKNYNWLTTELVNWKQLDGTVCQGVLYKPEDFNSQKKYPLIIHYYEKKSASLNQFMSPDYIQTDINIPWFVSRGYLVFTPDIHYSIASKSGQVVGDCAVNSVVSAVHYLSQRKYIDGKRIGIQGHSYGGGETLYLVTHSNLFAAACSGAPTVSNEISAYLGIVRANGKPVLSKMTHSEADHNRIGATLWERPDLYIKASPVFKANKVTTPLLIMHNQGDVTCDWNQGVEMYMALWRLGKPVWMLQYDNEGHGVSGKNAVDYTMRMTQFFDHYLKGAVAPRWMTEGIPANLKGVISGYELDVAGSCEENCAICTHGESSTIKQVNK